jgi:hypothetical protein
MRARVLAFAAAYLHRFNLAVIGLLLAYTMIQAFRREGLDLSDESTTSRHVGDLLMFALLCALASFAVVEVLKRLFNLRGWYQLERTKLWLSARVKDREAAFGELIQALGVNQRRRDVRQLFNLPTEQLAAQIGLAADVALASPSHYDALIEGLTGWQLDDPESRAKNEDAMRQLAHRVRAGVDQLQITLAEEWRRSIQGAVMWIAGLFGIGFAFAGDVGAAAHTRHVLVALILGGVFAWTVRDLARVIENARR